MNNWTTAQMPDQTDRIAIVTGANSGLGYETALELARKGAQVVMAIRNVRKGEEARDMILQQVPNAKLDLRALDLSSLDSVRAFAEGYKADYDRLDLLINNAGLMAVPQGETQDGFEMQMGVNHLGHFALTGLLIDLLIQTPGSRVVSVSSFAHLMGRMDFNDLQSNKNYTRYGAYGNSKLANILFARELQRRLDAAGADTLSLVAHPGYSDTNLQHNSTTSSGNTLERIVYGVMNRFAAQPQEMGVLPQLYAATAPQAEGAKFYGPRWLFRGYPKEANASKAARSDADARRLWAESEKLTGVRYEALDRAAVRA